MDAKKTLHPIVYMGVVFLSIFALFSCGGSDSNTNGADKSEGEILPLNISVFIDLSDRIEPTYHPLQMGRDTAIVGYLANLFEKHTVGKQIQKSKNCFNVIFYPTPTNPQVTVLAKQLKCDVSEYNGIEKRIHVENLDSVLKYNLAQIYQIAIQAKSYHGCDIWDFFNSKRVDSYCIKEGFRNVLVILTDGYLLEVGNKQTNGHETNYINNQLLSDLNFKLMAKRDGLENLEVRILEINPTDKKLKERMKSVLETWLTDMGVRPENITIEQNDLADNGIEVINGFLKP